MAKTIKFNLICDGHPVRTIEDLQNNFSIEDILAYYNNGLLQRWLRARGYTAELEAVNAISCNVPMGIIKELIRIFDIGTDVNKVEESIYMLQYLGDRKLQHGRYEQENYMVSSIIDDYETGYSQCVERILRNTKDAAIIKAAIAEIVSNYALILKRDHRNLFYTLQKKSAYLPIMCLLMNEGSRHYYLPVRIIPASDGTCQLEVELDNTDKDAMYTLICEIVRRSDFATILGDNLRSFSGNTDAYWIDLEPKGIRYMIIHMENRNRIRSAGHSGGDLSGSDVINKFVILDGIDYKSNYASDKLLYMEV